jgi:hypothetical protein
MNPTPDAATLQQALPLFYVVAGTMTLLGLVQMVLGIAGFFRRQPPIDQTIAGLVREFNTELGNRVHVRDWEKCEARHAQQVRDIESRYCQLLRDMESRFDARMAGLHGSVVEVRTGQQAILKSLNQIVRDMKIDARVAPGATED